MVHFYMRAVLTFVALAALLIILNHNFSLYQFLLKRVFRNGDGDSTLFHKAHYRKDYLCKLTATNLGHPISSANATDLFGSALNVPMATANSYEHSNSQLSYKTDFPTDYFSKLDDESMIHCGMLEFLDVVNPRHALNSVSEADLSNAVIVSAIDLSHFDDFVYMCTSMGAYKKFGSNFERRLILFLLGAVEEKDLKRLTELCNFIEIRLFPYHLFPDYFRNLYHYRFKSAVVALMLKEYYVVYWLDSSNRFDESDNATSFEEYFSSLKERNIPFAMSGLAYHSILATTQPIMYEYLPIEEKRKEVDAALAGTMLFIGTKELKSTILLRLLQCAFIDECMAPPGHRLECKFKDAVKEYADCHRYDLSAVNIIVNLYTDNRTDRYIVPFQALSIRRHVP